jgi:glycosyltransferase involved in cell wall biosynthesis
MNIQQQLVIPRNTYKSSPDVFHYPHFDLPFLVPGSIIATIYDLKYISQPNFFPRMSSIKRFIMWGMMWFTVHRAQRVIAISEHTRKDILRFINVDPARIIVVPLGVDDHYFLKPSQSVLKEIRDRYSLLCPFILFVGERRPHKNITGLIKAYKTLQNKYSVPHHLVLIGKPYADYQEPEQLAANLGLTHRVHFLDYVNDADLATIYWLADLFVTLSLYEGVGLPVFEAMASCTPVIAAWRTSLPEIVGNAGLLVNPDIPENVAHEILNVISDGELKRTYIEKGLARAQKYSWERCAYETLEVYKQSGN